MAERTAIEHARKEAHTREPLHRPAVAGACSLAALAVLVAGLVALPRDGAPLSRIARYAMEIALPQWHITEPVNEIVYGTRGFDTFGETFLLIAAIVSVATLARHREPRQEFVGEEAAGEREQRENDPDAQGGGDLTAQERAALQAEAEEAGQRPRSGDEESADTNPLGATAPEHSEAMTVVIRVAARTVALILAVAAIYVCARGYSPGGGFPGGAALAGVALLLYAALGYRAIAPVARPEVLEPIELIGAVIIIGLATTGLVLRGAVMANWIPLAPVHTIASGGLLQAFSVMELVEVGTGLTIAVVAMLSMKHDWTPDASDDSSDDADGRPPIHQLPAQRRAASPGGQP